MFLKMPFFQFVKSSTSTTQKTIDKTKNVLFLTPFSQYLFFSKIMIFFYQYFKKYN